MSTTNRQSGAVSIFVVIFAALLLSIITISFVRVMLADQRRASNEDLSQSAYDSAMTGVEDAKRALLNYQRNCQNGGTAVCAVEREKVTGGVENLCNAGLLVDDIIGSGDVADDSESGNGEILIQQSTGDAQLDQAYTCVKIALDTPDYLGDLTVNKSKLIPLIAADNDSASGFNEVTIEWFSTKDLGEGVTSVSLEPEVTTPATAQPLYNQSAWPGDRPPLMRAGLMQVGGTFSMADFDAMNVAGQSNANTLFLYPVSSPSPVASATNFDRDTRQVLESTVPAGNDATYPTSCSDEVTGDAGSYSCKITLKLPTPINAGQRTSYLRLTSLYNNAHFRVTLSKDGAPVNFSDVQAEVDSTGRANDLFRRVKSRIDMIDTTFSYPEGSVDVGGNLCKDFSVTDTAYRAGTCTP